MLSILGFITVFIAAFYIYKTAKDTNRNAVGWALLTLAVGFGLQFFFPILIVFLIAAAMAVSGKPLTNIDGLPWSMDIIIVLIGWAVSFFGIWLIMRRVSTIPDEENFIAPPSPPTFDGR